VLFISNGPGGDPENPAIGRILSEQDIKVARIADARIAEAFDRLDISTEEEFRALRDDLRWVHDCRKALAGLRQKLFWLVLGFAVVGLLGFCARSTLDGIKRGLTHEAGQYPAR
jgi:hypothetical protein